MKSKIPTWCDRQDLKKDIEHWLAQWDQKKIFLSFTDRREVEDVLKWLKEENNNVKIANVFIDSSSDVSRLGVLESIIKSLGKEHFGNVCNFISDDHYLIENHTFTQIIGSDIDSEHAVSLTKNINSQNITLNYVDYGTRKYHFLEANINKIFDLFVPQYRKYVDSKKVLIVCKIKGNYNDINVHVRMWFEDIFIRELEGLRNSKICLLCENEDSNLSALFDFPFIRNTKKLFYADILKESKEIIQEYKTFCTTIVDEEDCRQVEYSLYKSKLTILCKPEHSTENE